MSFAKEITSAAFAAINVNVPFGSLPASTNFDSVDVYADITAYSASAASRITFYLYGRLGTVDTLLQTLAPRAVQTPPGKLFTLKAEPGLTYYLEAAVTSGPVLPGVAIKAGLVGYDAQSNEPSTVDGTASPTALVYGVETVIADSLSVHASWNVRVDVQGAPYPDVTYRLYSIVTQGANTITALIASKRVTTPPLGGVEVFDQSDFGSDHIRVTAQPNDVRATGANAISLKHATIGTDVWVDNGQISAANLAQTAWYINAVTGNDAWDGTAAVNVAGSAVGPIKTAAEYLRRTGLNRPIANPVDIYIGSDLPAGDPLIITGDVITSTGYMFVHGTNLVQIATGTLTGYTAPAAATNTLPSVTDALVADWTPYAGKFLRPTSGAHTAQSAGMWIVKNLGGGAARCSNPAYSSDQTNCLSYVPAGNETYEIVSPRLLGGGLVVQVSAASSQYVRFEFVTIPPSGAGVVRGFSYTGGLSLYACLFPAMLLASSSYSYFMNCQFQTLFNVTASNALFQAGYINNASVSVFAGRISFQNCPVTVRAGTLTIGGGGFAEVQSSGVQIADTTNYWKVTQGSQLAIRGSIYGTVDAGTMYEVDSGSKMLVSDPTLLRIGGTINDMVVAGKTQIFPIDVATGLPAGAVQTCSIANFQVAGPFVGNINDPLTGTQVLTAP